MAFVVISVPSEAQVDMTSQTMQQVVALEKESTDSRAKWTIVVKL